MNVIAPVIITPTTAQTNTESGEMLPAPANAYWDINQKPMIESTPATAMPRYSEPMMRSFLMLTPPTNNVPTIEATIDSAPINSGKVVAFGTVAPNTRLPSSIAATVVTQ